MFGRGGPTGLAIVCGGDASVEEAAIRDTLHNRGGVFLAKKVGVHQRPNPPGARAGHQQVGRGGQHAHRSFGLHAADTNACAGDAATVTQNRTLLLAPQALQPARGGSLSVVSPSPHTRSPRTPLCRNVRNSMIVPGDRTGQVHTHSDAPPPSQLPPAHPPTLRSATTPAIWRWPEK